MKHGSCAAAAKVRRSPLSAGVGLRGCQGCGPSSQPTGSREAGHIPPPPAEGPAGRTVRRRRSETAA